MLTEDKKDVVKDGSSFTISESVSIDYDKYNNLVNKFRTNYAVNTSSYLDVYLQVEEKNKSDNSYKISNVSKTSLKIPLSQQEININLNDQRLDNEQKIISNEKFVVKNEFLLIVSIVLFVITFVYFVRYICNFIKLLNILNMKNNEYDKFINKILKGYDRIIVNVKTAVDPDNYNVIDVTDFQELVDVRDNVKEPINYFIIEEHQSSIFYLIHNEDLYLYMVSLDDFVEENLMRKNRLYVSILIIIVFTVYFLSIGFSAISVSGRIENIMASVKPQGLVRITNVLTSDTTNSGISNSEDYNKNNINANIVLPNASSTVTYKVNVTVYLESIMKISNITLSDPSLDYELSGYIMGNALCNSNNDCNLGATDEIYLTIKYKEGMYDSSNTEHSFVADFTFETLDYVAKIGSDFYDSLQEAIDAVPDNTKTTIVMLKNTSESLTILQNKNIVFDFQNYTLSNFGANKLIDNYGTIEITNGIITSSAAYAVMDNNPGGKVTISGGSLVATGSRGAIYNSGGILEISGNSKYIFYNNWRKSNYSKFN